MEDQKQSHKLLRVIKVVEGYDYLCQERIWYYKGRKIILCGICINYYLIFHQKIHKSNFMLKFISVKIAIDIQGKLTGTQTICCKIKKNNKKEEINLNKTNYNN